MHRSRSLHTLLLRTATAAVLCLLATLTTAQAQTRWVVDPKGSLAWWQIDPNMNHLWGTTCPQEPSWRPGEGRSGGWSTEEAMNAKTLAHGFSDVSDTIHVPLYPRRRVRFVCTEAIQGQFVLPDTLQWRGAHGQLVINPKDLVTGETMRDNYEQNAVLSVSVYQDIKFTLDSVVDMTRRGDTLRGRVVGTWFARSNEADQRPHQSLPGGGRHPRACEVRHSGEGPGKRLRSLEAHPGPWRDDGDLEEPV